MTYESLIAEFRLRVLKTDEDYAAAKAFWDDRVRLAINHCRSHDADGVQDYAEVLTLLMGQHEQKKLDEYEPTEPEDNDWVTEDYVTFREHGGKGVFRIPLGVSWQIAVKDRMDLEQFWPNVWYRGERGDYELLNLEDEE